METKPFVLTDKTQGRYSPLAGDFLGAHVRPSPDVVLFAGTRELRNSFFDSLGDFSPDAPLFLTSPNGGMFTRVTATNDGPDTLAMVIDASFPHGVRLQGDLSDHLHVLIRPGETFDLPMLAKELSFAVVDNNDPTNKTANLRYVLCGREVVQEAFQNYNVGPTTKRLYDEGR